MGARRAAIGGARGLSGALRRDGEVRHPARAALNLDTATGDDYDFDFEGVADPADVVAAVHRAQREADVTLAGT